MPPGSIQTRRRRSEGAVPMGGGRPRRAGDGDQLHRSRRAGRFVAGSAGRAGPDQGRLRHHHQPLPPSPTPLGRRSSAASSTGSARGWASSCRSPCGRRPQCCTRWRPGWRASPCSAACWVWRRRANWPGATKSNAEWFPIDERALAQGVFNSGAAIGGIISAPLVGVMFVFLGTWQANLRRRGRAGLPMAGSVADRVQERAGDAPVGGRGGASLHPDRPPAARRRGAS